MWFVIWSSIIYLFSWYPGHHKNKRETETEDWVDAKLLQSCLILCDPMDCSTRQAPLSIGFSRQEYWSGLLCPPPGNLPSLGIKPLSLMSPASPWRFFTTSTTWELGGYYSTCIVFHSFNKHLLNAAYMPGIMLVNGDTLVVKGDVVTAFLVLRVSGETD